MSDGTLDPEPAYDVALMSIPKMASGVLADLSFIRRQLDPARLAPPPDLHLRLHYDRVTQRLAHGNGFVRRYGYTTGRDRDAKTGEVLLALVLEKVHWLSLVLSGAVGAELLCPTNERAGIAHIADLARLQEVMARRRCRRRPDTRGHRHTRADGHRPPGQHARRGRLLRLRRRLIAVCTDRATPPDVRRRRLYDRTRLRRRRRDCGCRRDARLYAPGQRHRLGRGRARW